MDPVSILGLIASVGSVASIAVKSISKLSDFKAKYRDAPFAVTLLLGQLCTIQTALDRLKVWSETNAGLHPRYDELSKQLQDALACFKPLMTHLHDQLSIHEHEERHGMARKQRLCFIWKESQLKDYFSMLDAQVNALTLLLQAVQCRSWTDQRHFLSEPDSKVIIRVARDCSTSIIAVRDGNSSVHRDSLVSELDDISQCFDFDNTLLHSRVYTTTYRSHLKTLADKYVDHIQPQQMSEAASVKSDTAQTTASPGDSTPFQHPFKPANLSIMPEEMSLTASEGPDFRFQPVATQSIPSTPLTSEEVVSSAGQLSTELLIIPGQVFELSTMPASPKLSAVSPFSKLSARSAETTVSVDRGRIVPLDRAPLCMTVANAKVARHYTLLSTARQPFPESFSDEFDLEREDTASDQSHTIFDEFDPFGWNSYVASQRYDAPKELVLKANKNGQGDQYTLYLIGSGNRIKLGINCIEGKLHRQADRVHEIFNFDIAAIVTRASFGYRPKGEAKDVAIRELEGSSFKAALAWLAEYACLTPNRHGYQPLRLPAVEFCLGLVLRLGTRDLKRQTNQEARMDIYLRIREGIDFCQSPYATSADLSQAQEVGQLEVVILK